MIRVPVMTGPKTCAKVPMREREGRRKGEIEREREHRGAYGEN